jgi:hypothetical protein
MTLAVLRAVLRTGRGPSVVPIDAGEVATAVALARTSGATVRRLDGVPSSKAELLDALAAALAFPPWWGRNWDALEECLVELADVRAVVLDVWRAAARHHARPLVLVLAS